MKALCSGTKSQDLYDGFVSVNLLDFTTGVALDFFACNDIIASVYALLPFPGVPEPTDIENAEKPKYWFSVISWAKLMQNEPRRDGGVIQTQLVRTPDV